MRRSRGTRPLNYHDTHHHLLLLLLVASAPGVLLVASSVAAVDRGSLAVAAFVHLCLHLSAKVASQIPMPHPEESRTRSLITPTAAAATPTPPKSSQILLQSWLSTIAYCSGTLPKPSTPKPSIPGQELPEVPERTCRAREAASSQTLKPKHVERLGIGVLGFRGSGARGLRGSRWLSGLAV